jgi:hypothetical protein
MEIYSALSIAILSFFLGFFVRWGMDRKAIEWRDKVIAENAETFARFRLDVEADAQKRAN